MPAFAPGATFLGSATLGSANATVGPVVFGPGWGILLVYHYIAGYSGSAIALIQVGTGATADTGNTYSCYASLLAAAAVTSTALSTTNGIKVGQDATTNGRRGMHEIWNGSGAPSFFDSRTVTYTSQAPTAVSAVQTSQSLVTGTWFNNAQAQCVQMVGSTAGGITLNSGSFISVYGIPGTG